PRSGRLRASEGNLVRVAGELEVPAPARGAFARDAHGAFPVERARARAGVELLVVHERLDGPAALAQPELHRDGIVDAGARRAPRAAHGEAHVVAREAHGRAALRAKSGLRP